MRIRFSTLGLVVIGASALGWLAAELVADPPAPPKLSAVVPVEDLVAAVRSYVKEFEAALADEKEYAANAEKLKKESNTLVIVALVLAQHDSANDLSKTAPALVKAAQTLARSKDYAAARQGLTAIQDALAGKATSPAEVKWEKVAGLGQVMKQAEFINSRLRTSLRRFDPRKAEENARHAAVLAAIGQAIVYDTHEVKDPKELPKWYQFCAEMRDSASELNAKIKAGDKAGAGAAITRVGNSCKACHEVFYPME